MKLRTTLKPSAPGSPGQFTLTSIAESDNPPDGSSQVLAARRVLVTGGDSLLGRAVALACARNGADITLAYTHEDRAAAEARDEIRGLGRRCILLGGQLDDPYFCQQVVSHAVSELGGLDILINNIVHDAAVGASPTAPSILHTDVFSMFYITRAAIPHLGSGGSIINTAAISTPRGISRWRTLPPAGEAIASYTRSLARGLAAKKVRVNAVAFDSGAPASASNPPAPADEGVARCYVFLASAEAGELTGQVLCPQAEHLNFTL